MVNGGVENSQNLLKRFKIAIVKILSIETSCDETGIALLECSGGIRAPKFKVLKNAVSLPQIPIHRPFGGVVPNIAKREHLKALPILCEQVLGDEKAAAKIWKTIDLITVRLGRGLEPALSDRHRFCKTAREGTPKTAHRRESSRGAPL